MYRLFLIKKQTKVHIKDYCFGVFLFLHSMCVLLGGHLTDITGFLGASLSAVSVFGLLWSVPSRCGTFHLWKETNKYNFTGVLLNLLWSHPFSFTLCLIGNSWFVSSSCNYRILISNCHLIMKEWLFKLNFFFISNQCMPFKYLKCKNYLSSEN